MLLFNKSNITQTFINSGIYELLRKMTEQKDPKVEREERLKFHKKTLESALVQTVIGASDIKQRPNFYGELDFQTANGEYDNTKSSEEFNTQRGKLYQERLKDGKKDPRNPESVPMVTDYEVIQSYLAQVDEAFTLLSLGDLEAKLKEIGGNKAVEGAELPDELKKYSMVDLMSKGINEKGQFSEKKMVESLDEKEKQAYIIHQELKESYTRACALNVKNRGDPYADLKQKRSMLKEAYAKKAESKR